MSNQAKQKFMMIEFKAIINCWTHWGRVMHIYISKLIILGSDNGLLPNKDMSNQDKQK